MVQNLPELPFPIWNFILSHGEVAGEIKELQVSLVSGTTVTAARPRFVFCFLNHPYFKILLPFFPSWFPPINISVIPVCVLAFWLFKESFVSWRGSTFQVQRHNLWWDMLLMLILCVFHWCLYYVFFFFGDIYSHVQLFSFSFISIKIKTCCGKRPFWAGNYLA